MAIETTTDPVTATESNAEYLIFYSSVNSSTQKMWCPDCVRVEDYVKAFFERDNTPSALIVFVGQREEWRANPANVYRGEPWKITSVPTILRRHDSARLVDDEITDASLQQFAA